MYSLFYCTQRSRRRVIYIHTYSSSGSGIHSDAPSSGKRREQKLAYTPIETTDNGETDRLGNGWKKTRASRYGMAKARHGSRVDSSERRRRKEGCCCCCCCCCSDASIPMPFSPWRHKPSRRRRRRCCCPSCSSSPLLCVCVCVYVFPHGTKHKEHTKVPSIFTLQLHSFVLLSVATRESRVAIQDISLDASPCLVLLLLFSPLAPVRQFHCTGTLSDWPFTFFSFVFLLSPFFIPPPTQHGCDVVIWCLCVTVYFVSSTLLLFFFFFFFFIHTTVSQIPLVFLLVRLPCDETVSSWTTAKQQQQQ